MARLSALPSKYVRDAKRANKRAKRVARTTAPTLMLKSAIPGRPADSITEPTIHAIQKAVWHSMPESDMLRIRALRAINAQTCTEAEGRAILADLRVASS